MGITRNNLIHVRGLLWVKTVKNEGLLIKIGS